MSAPATRRLFLRGGTPEDPVAATISCPLCRGTAPYPEKDAAAPKRSAAQLLADYLQPTYPWLGWGESRAEARAPPR